MVTSKPEPATLWRFMGDALAGYPRAAPAHQIHRMPGAVMTLTGEPFADFNYVLISAGPAPAERLRAFGAIIQAQQLPVVVMISADVAEQLAPVAQDLGLTHAGSMPLMTHDGQGLSHPEHALSVMQIEHEGDLRVANTVMARAFSLPEDAVQRLFGPELLDTPGLGVFLARQGDTPVSAVLTTRHGATVGIWTMATAPESQRHGYGGMLLTEVMARHRASGARLFYLGATEVGYPLYERLGFRTVESIEVWVAGHSTQVHG